MYDLSRAWQIHLCHPNVERDNSLNEKLRIHYLGLPWEVCPTIWLNAFSTLQVWAVFPLLQLWSDCRNVLLTVIEQWAGSHKSRLAGDAERYASPAERGPRSRQVQDVETDTTGQHKAACRHVWGNVDSHIQQFWSVLSTHDDTRWNNWFVDWFLGQRVLRMFYMLSVTFLFILCSICIC